MRVIWYVFVAVLGAIGALSIFRVVERLIAGGGRGSVWGQLLIGIVCIFGAWQSLRRARVR